MPGTPNPDAIVSFEGDPAGGGGGSGRRSLRVSGSAPPSMPSGPHIESGLANFTVGGSGEGHDYVTVVFTRQFGNANYPITMTVRGGADPSVSVPDANPYQITIGGFRIYPQAQFNGSVSWRAADSGL